MNFGWLQDKRMRFVAQTLPSLISLIGIFLGFVNQVGYVYAALIATIGALLLWIFANQVVEKASPTSKDVTVQPTVSSKIACDPGPYKVVGGDDKIIKLNVKKGDVIKGHLRELDTTPFDWYITDEMSMVFYKRRQWSKMKRLGEGEGEPAYAISLTIPTEVRWFLILDNHGKSNYRTILADFEPIA